MDTLLSTKFYIPPLQAGGITRPRLAEKLLAGVERPANLSLLSGPAGFGKTTVLSEFVAKLQRPAAWLSLDEGDNDPIRFWTYLIAACQAVHAGLGEAALALFPSPQPLPVEAIPTILINDLARLDGDLTLVLDDFHAIQNPSIHAAMAFLIDHLPARLHLVLSTRSDPPWPLARLRARNQLTEIRAQDLRFTTEEAAAFLQGTMGLDLTAEAVEALEARTEGWIAGLQLAALAMQAPHSKNGHNHVTSFIQAFTGSHVYIAEYLVEEVLQRQPEAVQTFLVHTSILERLNGRLCEAVTECEEGQSILTALRRANLFIIPLDDEGRWFRYHHLFADLLQARLRQNLTFDDIAALHKRAAAWYAQEGMTGQAIEHALAARDYPAALQQIEKAALPTMLQAHVQTVEGWLLAIPAAYLDRNPRFNLAFAWLNMLRGAIAQASPYLERVEAILAAAAAQPPDPSLQGEWLAVQSRLRNAQGKPAESCDLANLGLQIAPEADVHVRSMLLVNLATAYTQMLDYEHAAQTFQQIVRNARANGDFISETLGLSGEAQMVLQQGRLKRGFEVASEGIARVEAAGRATPFSATLYGEIGLIYYHWHHIDEAQRYLLHSMQASGSGGYSDPEIHHHIMRSRIHQMEGDWQAAAQEMELAGELLRQTPPVMVREEFISQQVRVYLATGQMAAAQAMLEAEGFYFDADPYAQRGPQGAPALFDSSGPTIRFPELPPGAKVTHPTGLLYNSALRVLLTRAKIDLRTADVTDALELAERVLAGELQCQQTPSALETLLLRAQLYAARRDDHNCLAETAKALELAETEGFISVFIEEGAPMAEILTRLQKRKLFGRIQPDYVQKILSAFPVLPEYEHDEALAREARRAETNVGEAVSETPVENLTGREMEVLRLIAAGDSNRAIAERLVISVSAVKKHTANIYRKLNVDSRTQAVAHARQLRLL